MSLARPVSDPPASPGELSIPSSWPDQPLRAAGSLELLVSGSGVRPRSRPPVDERSRYPTSDGKPLAETSTHLEVIFAVWAALRVVAERVARTFVGSNQLVYFEQNNSRKCFAPDCYVLLDTDHTEPPNILTWLDGVPACIIEVTSKKTRRKDIYDKFQLYQTLGVHEYVMFDPLEDYLKPTLQVHRLVEGVYQSQPGGADGYFPLNVLPVELYREGRWLRVRDTQTGEHLPLLGEYRTQAQLADRELAKAEATARATQHALEQERFKVAQERAKAEATSRAAQQAVEQERARAEQERISAAQERARAEQERITAAHERARAEQERITAAQERARAEKAEAQLLELQRMLTKLGMIPLG